MYKDGDSQVEEDAKPDPGPTLKVGLVYNLKKHISSHVADAEAEYDNIETVHAIREAIEDDHCRVELMEADETLPGRLAKHTVDIVFNIAEGIQGRGREAEVPALCNMLRIPFTGSDETTLCIALDKALTKRLLATYRIRTPRYRVIAKDQPRIGGGFAFPAIVKPNAEGSSKGISDVAIVSDVKALRALAEKNIRDYWQDMLVEEYIPGREFTVGILGNGGDARVFAPMEIIYLDKQNPYHIYSFTVKQNYEKLIRYKSPADIGAQTEAEMVRTARKVFDVLQCRDFARMDFRLAPGGKLYFIEINPLPGLAPGYSDYPMLAEFNGTDYTTLVRGVLKAALSRYGMISYLQRGNHDEH
jgi:D-alanine-D-alanine ligase